MDRIWLWICYNQILIYSIFYLLKGDYRVYRAYGFGGSTGFTGFNGLAGLRVWGLHV